MLQIFAKKKKRGFTLIELLVVIAIIGILAGLVLVSMGGPRSKGRDAKREADIRQISIAMEMAYDDEEAYPTTTVVAATGRLDITGIGSYLSPLPRDPGGGSVTNCNDTKNAPYKAYDNSSDTSQYCIWACLENGGFFVASEKGTLATDTEPANLDCW